MFNWTRVRLHIVCVRWTLDWSYQVGRIKERVFGLGRVRVYEGGAKVLQSSARMGVHSRTKIIVNLVLEQFGAVNCTYEPWVAQLGVCKHHGRAHC